MEYIAIAKNIKVSPRKVRLVVDSMKKKDLSKGLSVLSLMPKRAAQPIKKALDSAVANAVNNFKVDRGALSIRDIIVTEGARLKRYHFAARGRVRPYKRRMSHIRVILTDNVKQESPRQGSGQARVMNQGENKIKEGEHGTEG
jgi:large subunit ribosomal protein L22